ncbi:hypothetical protein KGQ27_00930 [Patescibacteria group bacterium]|nr:hypothetical protein [Patescibacteria group bacterium]MDE1946591.1 hypothetical protein [Patescibacteria group bacterium]MDE2010846.1 hypothetical protein [Patescibacteria group bacterium]MDE2233218.1 hypothetical protein [Patescibacteria group bacterium]
MFKKKSSRKKFVNYRANETHYQPIASFAVQDRFYKYFFLAILFTIVTAVYVALHIR